MSEQPAKFHLGRIVATPGALASIPQSEIFEALYRHERGDWGELDPHDVAENERGLQNGLRLLSAYNSKASIRFWIITEHDRSVTTILLPMEY